MSKSDYAIQVEGLGKQYRLGLEQNGSAYRYKSLRNSLRSVAKRPFHAMKNTVIRQPLNETNSFWALKDINFDVKKGEVLGIIGRNGAGKSTLLKVLSRITRPTTGQVDLYGRVGSLLEVGTGFHPELSGRENIYLNGAVLGMTRSEVKAKFDEIVAFSEIEKFLETPVKQYSSGMYMRLAFAVAAHLKPEILIIDEVLAVGDLEFQNKCLGRMKDVAEEGRTVLFVSHNMAAVQKLCSSVVLLKDGRINLRSSPSGAISAYHLSARNSFSDRRTRIHPIGNLITGLSINSHDAMDGPVDVICGHSLQFKIKLDSTVVHRGLSVHIGIYDMLGNPLMHFSSRSSLSVSGTNGSGNVICDIPKLPLAPQDYKINLALIQDGEEIDHLTNVAIIKVQAGDFFGNGDTSSMAWAPCLVLHQWSYDDSI